MRNRLLLKFVATPFGIALLLAGLFFHAGSARSDSLQAIPTPTPDRLAQPTLPASPSQADHGAQVYWLSCLPCHGDKGQGLTDEFRTTYPPEEQYCWERGCHGKNPYENGFVLPTKIPAVIGPEALAKFSDAAQLNSYVRATMPFWDPGSLTQEQAWQVTAFILRANELWDGAGELDESNAGRVKIPRGTPTPVATPQQAQVPDGRVGSGWVSLLGVLLLLSALLFILKKSRNTTTI